MKKIFSILAAILVAGSMWAEETKKATFSSVDAVNNSAYATTYGGDDWSISMGGNNKSIGFNNKNCTTIGNALGTSATAANYGVVVKSKNAIANVSKITFTYSGGSGQGGTIYLAYSTNNTNWSAISLNSGAGLTAQGATVASELTNPLVFEFAEIASAYYAIILDKGNTTKEAYRFDNVVVDFIQVTGSGDPDPAGPALTAVTVSGTASNTIYTEGDAFNPAGLVVTGTYDNDSQETITEGINWTVTPATLSVGTTSVRVVATVNSIASSEYVVNGLTVNPHVATPGTYVIETHNTLWGTTYNGQVAGITNLSGSQDDVTINLYKNEGAAMYVTGSQTRVYNDYTMVFTVPAGFAITNIVFTADGNNWAGTHTASVGEMTDNKTWAGAANSVTINFAGTCRMKKATVTYKAVVANVAISAAEYATYFNATEAYVMPAGLEGIIVEGVSGTTLTLESRYAAGDVVPAGEALILHGEAKNYTLVAGTTANEPLAANMLKGTSTAEDYTEGGVTYYRLSQHDGQVGFYYGAADGAAFQPGANKAYLALNSTSDAPAHFLFENGEQTATGIENTEANDQVVKFIENGKVYILRAGVVYDVLGNVIR